MKIREFRLQKGIFIYKTGILFTKVDFCLQNGSLGLQMGLSPCYLPFVIYSFFSLLQYNNLLLFFNKYLLTFENACVILWKMKHQILIAVRLQVMVC